MCSNRRQRPAISPYDTYASAQMQHGRANNRLANHSAVNLVVFLSAVKEAPGSDQAAG